MSERTIYRAKSIALEQDCITFEESFAKLPSYFRSLEKVNPSMKVHIQISDGRFRRCFVGFGNMVDVLKKCGFGFFGLDGSHIKHPKWREATLLLLCGVDGEGSTIPICICYSNGRENDSLLSYFTDMCLDMGLLALLIGKKSICVAL